MKCLICNNEATEKHHIIFRSQGGTDAPENLANLCRECHHSIHFGKDTEVRKYITGKLYDIIRPHLSKCWKGKYPPKIIRLLESENSSCN
ncbi:MAG TPA: HNH endonuclease [Spirochaetota bacterium]|nr:HNH endonuclease [Spirochaetota bacterium]HQQ24268.1 HNH endonuclease [Spirochaetota bacterium]